MTSLDVPEVVVMSASRRTSRQRSVIGLLMDSNHVVVMLIVGV